TWPAGLSHLACGCTWRAASFTRYPLIANCDASGFGYELHHQRDGSSAHLVQSLNQSADIAETKGERLLSSRIIGSLRHVVGHQHTGVVNLLVNLDGFHEVDITLIRVYF